MCAMLATVSTLLEVFTSCCTLPYIRKFRILI